MSLRTKRGNLIHVSLQGEVGFLLFARNRRGNLMLMSLRTKRGNLIKTDVFFSYEIAALPPVVRNDKERN
jgi:hypothetical protein